MSFLLLGLAIQLGSFLVAMGSYLVAMVRFEQALADAGIAPELDWRRPFRHVEDPVGTIPQATIKRTILPLRKSPDRTAEARRRMMRRRVFLAVILLWGGLAWPFTGWLLDEIARRAAQSGSALGYVFLAMDIGVVVAVIAAIGYLAFRYAFGYRVRRSAAATWLLTLAASWLLFLGQFSVLEAR